MFEGRPDLIQTDAETPSEIATRAMTEAEAQRVLQALDTPERRHTLPIFLAVMDTGVRKGSLLNSLCWKDINFELEIITVTACQGEGKNKKQWPVPMTARLKKELLKLHRQRRTTILTHLCFRRHRSTSVDYGLRHTPKRKFQRAPECSTLCVILSPLNGEQRYADACACTPVRAQALT